MFAVSDGATGWRVLPGGLTRIATGDLEIASMQRGGSSADTWVLTEGEVDATSLLHHDHPSVDTPHRSRTVTSRVLNLVNDFEGFAEVGGLFLDKSLRGVKAGRLIRSRNQGRRISRRMSTLPRWSASRGRPGPPCTGRGRRARCWPISACFNAPAG